MSPLSNDPNKREIQIRNLKRGNQSNPGNRSRQTHGILARVDPDELRDQAREVIEALGRDELSAEVDRIYEALASAAPVRTQDGNLPPADAVAVLKLAEALIRARRASRAVVEYGTTSLAAKRYEVETDNQVLKWATVLGMTPLARSQLGLNVALGLSAAERLQRHLDERYGDAIDGEETSE
jgi:hypothetical protein